MATPSKAPKIGEYSGRGRLESWVRVLAVRVRSDLERRRRIIADDSETLLENLTDPTDSPEIAYLKDTYRREFSQALTCTLRNFDAESRNLLRGQLVDGLTHRQLAKLYSVHPDTIKRRLARLRASVLAEVHKSLACRFGAENARLQSIWPLVASRTSALVQACLAQTRP